MAGEGTQFYLDKMKDWVGTPDEKYQQWDSTYNDVSPPPSQSFLTDTDLAEYLNLYCTHVW